MSDKEFTDVEKRLSEKPIRDHTLDDSIEYILESLKHTQYNQDAQDYFKRVMEHVRSLVK